MLKFFAKFVKDDDGATAIEYALIALLISTVIITAATNIGTNLNNAFTRVNAGFSK
ncbi:MAG: Flp family type IVb pilin [Hyphomicrobiaceae bacterium]